MEKFDMLGNTHFSFPKIDKTTNSTTPVYIGLLLGQDQDLPRVSAGC